MRITLGSMEEGHAESALVLFHLTLSVHMGEL